MRNLKLTSPRMTGSDVSAWQHFLIAQRVLTGDADGVFGPVTAESTRAYQTNRGIEADGIVGPGTFAQAVRDGFAAQPGRVAIAGLDANVDCTSFAKCIADAGLKFVVRYYASRASKTLTRAEAVALSRAGLQVAVVRQDFNNSIDRFSAEVGRQQAAKALDLATQIGQPGGSAIYFSVDFDPSPDQVRGTISDYFRAVSQALSTGPARYAVGVYGSGLTCRIIRDSGFAVFTWLAGSTGFRESKQFRPQATLLQSAPERKICNGKLSIDDDIAQAENFGAFTV
jgi:peptidoglycan hydrolase-like protein with peptidoglycan-binding domain